MHDITMTPQETIDFFIGTSWVGWYATQANEMITAKLSQPQKMRITAREAVSSDPPDCTVIIEGQHESDNLAPPRFYGSVNARGEVSMLYTYATERSLWPHHDMRRVGREDQCYGYITPFGIVGWLDPGSRVEYRFREMSDVFWMYREEWSWR